MNTKYRASPNPDKKQMQTKKETIARGEHRAKTMIRSPLQSGTTLPPLAEDITKETATESTINYSFKIQIKPEWAVLVTEQLGQGAMGMVFKGIEEIGTSSGHKELGGEVAIKIIHLDAKDLGSDPEQARTNLYEKFRSEVILLKKLNNDHIVRINAFGVTESPVDSNLVPYYTMDFLPGKDLEVTLKEKKTLSWEMVSDLMQQVCDALEDAHEYEEQGVKKPIIHRDIKPGNVFITTDKRGKETVKLLDFGIATITAPQKKKENQDQGIWGTLEYMSPEQATGQQTDHRTDIYSVGSMMYHLLIGKTVFSQEGAIEDRLMRIIEEVPKPMDGAGIDFPFEAQRIILKCLEKDPKKRYQSVRELQGAIQQINSIVNDGALECESTKIIDTNMKPAKKRKGLILGVLALSALAIGAGSVALFGKSKPADHNSPIIIQQTDSIQTSIEKDSQAPISSKVERDSALDSKKPSKDFKIVLKTNISRVEVLLEDQQICAPSKKRKCSFKLPPSTYPVEVTFRKRGYVDQKISVLPDMNKEVVIRMQRKYRKSKRKRVLPKNKTKFIITSE